MLRSLSLTLLIFVASVAFAASPSDRHVVVIMMENHEYSSIIGSSQAPYINSLAGRFALATHFYAQHHPSLPNYIELVAGSNMGLQDDSEDYVLANMFLGRQLTEAGFTNGVFAESMPGSEISERPCTFRTSGSYKKR